METLFQWEKIKDVSSNKLVLTQKIKGIIALIKKKIVLILLMGLVYAQTHLHNLNLAVI